MQLFVQNGWKQLELKALSHCQMYLKMFLLSDIVLGSRVEISMQFWEWYHLADSSLDWPRTSKPTPHLWYLWKTALMDILHLGRNQRLATPLGKWMAQQSWLGWYLHRATNLLWEAQPSQWICHAAYHNVLDRQSFCLQANLPNTHCCNN